MLPAAGSPSPGRRNEDGDSCLPMFPSTIPALPSARDGSLILIGTENPAAYNGLKGQTAGPEKDFGEGDAMSMNFAPRRRARARGKPSCRGCKPGFQWRIPRAGRARRFIYQARGRMIRASSFEPIGFQSSGANGLRIPTGDQDSHPARRSRTMANPFHLSMAPVNSK